jgi:hypothetical protein
MGQRRAVLGGVLLVGLLAGCATGKPARVVSWLDRSPFQTPAGPDVVRLDVALIERPIHDSYLTEEVWQLADEQLIPMDRRAILDDSGFRVGLLSGLKPGRLQALLSSDQSCANPRRFFAHGGHTVLLALGPTRASCRFQLPQEGQAAPISFEQASFFVEVMPNLTGDGQIRLQFTPQIQYGEPMLAPQVTEDNSGLLLVTQRPRKSYPTAGWEVTLAPNQYLIVGARARRPESLAGQCFLRWDETAAVQRLLVLRASTTNPSDSPEESAEPEDENANPARNPPVALQASWTNSNSYR